MSERLRGVPLSREVQRGFIAHQVAFDEGEVVFDSQELARERFESRQRNAEPNGFIKHMPGERSGNQSLYDAIAKADSTRQKRAPLQIKPRGYSSEYWTLQQKQQKKAR